MMRRALLRCGARGWPERVRRYTRAAVCEDFDAPLAVRAWPLRDELAPDEVRVRCCAAGLNFAEALQLRGEYQEKLQPPFVPGNELSGVVEAVGARVTTVAVGDAVVALPRGGAWATDAVVHESACFPLRGLTAADVDFAAAAALACNYGTASMALGRRAGVQAGETVVITAAAGGVGLAAVDLAVARDCRVVACCGDDSKLAVAAARGAAAGVNYEKCRKADGSFDSKLFRAALGEAAPHGVDAAIDMVGNVLTEALVRLLNFEGRLVVVGFAGGAIPKIAMNLLLVKNCALKGVYWGAYAAKKPQIFIECMTEVVDMFVSGAVKPAVGVKLPLDAVNDAVRVLTGRASTGKVVLVMS